METATLYGAQISAPDVIVPAELRYCLYARKSSEAEEKQALSIDSQVKEMLAVAQRDGLNVIDIYRESHSAWCGSSLRQMTGFGLEPRGQKYVEKYGRTSVT